LRRDSDVVIDGDVSGQIAVFKPANMDDVAGLHDWRILFNLVNSLLYVAAAKQP